MASHGTRSLLTLICIIIAGCDFSIADDFVNLKCNPDNHGRLGHQSLLNCTVTLSKESRDKDAQVTRVIWTKEGAETPLIDTHLDGTFRPHFTFAEKHWNEGNVSMLVTNTMVADVGLYTCLVVTDSGHASSSISLSISAPYGTPTISNVTQKDPKVAMTLSCHATGGYPKGTIRWSDEHETDWTPSSKQVATETKDGRFSLTSELQLLKGSIFSKYTCAVHNSLGGREGEAHFNPSSVLKHKGSPGQPGVEEPQSNLAQKIVIPVVVIGSVIIGLLLVRLLKQPCQRSHGAVPANDANEDGEDEHKPTEPCASDTNV